MPKENLMKWMFRTRSLWIGLTTMFALLSLSVVMLSGCGKGEAMKKDPAGAAAVTNIDHSHGGWWCVEHGVPEEECAQCDKSLVAKFKEAGDWCEEHDRPESQCFICSPARVHKFVARYEAKTGHKPPKPEE
jgi:hypothetical protein|tara:strand:+ start:5675 stop:6070 length:396 start_codon:yes stop_codon:yes gene_type:complete